MVIVKSLGEHYSIFDIYSLYSNGTLSVDLSCLSFKRLLVTVSIKICISLLEIVFIIPNSADPGEISHYPSISSLLLVKVPFIYMKCSKCKTLAICKGFLFSAFDASATMI